MAVRVSQHAKFRAKERLDVAYKSKRNQLFNRALRYGHPSTHFAGEFKDYLEVKKKKHKNIGVKVYDNNIFIYKNNLIITVFPVPNKYLPVKDNFASVIRENKDLMQLYRVINKDDVSLEIVQKDNVNIVAGLFIDDVFQNFGVGPTELKAKNNAIQIYLTKINKLETVEGD